MRFLLILCLCPLHVLFGQGVKGTIRNSRGEPLPYASIQIRGTQVGTMSNGEGAYEISLKSGEYELQFQYLNHQTQVKKVTVSTDVVTVDVTLAEVAVQLAEVKIGRSKEDPAYTIMRKAIAAARFHQLETDSWSARTYVKGNFRIEKIPFLLEDAIKKANLQVGTTYVLESINDLQFRQPNQVTEKVVSIRSNFPPGSNPLINFARLSFYNSMLGELVSPLSPKSFGYYRFEYLGYFIDKGVTVNRIKVTPRSKGLNILDGTINLIEDSWSIHSLSFTFQDENGVSYSVRQLYSPFSNVWMPIQLETDAKFSILGAKGETRYVTSVRNYQVKVNPKYHTIPEIVDEKIDKEIAAGLKKTPDTKQATRKQLKTLVEKMEKEDRKERKKQGEDVTVSQNWSFKVDSLARKQSTNFWEAERQVPLTTLETKGYQRADSLYKVNEVKIRKDSVRNLPKFRVGQLLTGHTYNYGQRKELEWYPRTLTFESPVFDLLKMEFFNVVEGYVLKTGLRYTERLSRTKNWHVETNARYSFARTRLNGGIGAGYTVENTSIGMTAGRNVFQFNSANPISQGLNTYYSLVRELNFMKLYENSYANVYVNQRLGNTLSVNLTAALEERSPLQNNVRRGWVDVPDREFSSNDPENLELANQTGFQRHTATVLTGFVTYRPNARAAIMNDRRVVYGNGSIAFTALAKVGWAGNTPFSRVELGIRDEFRLFRNAFSYQVKAGTFLSKPSYFMDFRHFNGNQLLFQNPDISNFRTLPYYLYSTTNPYAEGHGEYQFQKFLLTQILPLRLYGIKESLQIHALQTKDINHIEIGYGFGGILKVLGAEAVGTFQNGNFTGMSFRIRSAF